MLDYHQSPFRKLRAKASPLSSVLSACALLFCGLGASAQITTTTNFTVGASILDDSLSGRADARTINTPITYMTGVRVALKITGTFDGDLYCYLAHSSGRTVLLNRVGRRSSSSLGYRDGGFNVTFDDAATNGDVHIYRLTLNGSQTVPLDGPLTNSWAPDARTNSPFNVLDTDPRAAFLASFNGLDPNGEWVLFVADVEAGDLHTLDSWGLEITGYAASSIAVQPANQSAECSSGSATFSVTASGTAPLNYQWRFAGAALPDQTNSSLSLPNVTFENAGNYDVVITNNYGSITSTVAVLTVVDTTPPVVTMAGPNPMTNECHGVFIDPGASATDSCAGVLSVVTNSTVDPNAVGSYTITYTATDPSGNPTSVARTVVVVDTTAPVITMLGANPMTNECHGLFIDPGATANDACAGSITVVTNSTVNPNAVGTYSITYTATDPSGNSSTTTRTVVVKDTVAPVVTMLGANPMTNECHGAFVDPGATATDTCAGPISVVTNTTVNPNADGSYTITYTATDPSGNTATATRTVYVNDTTPPVITMLGNNPMTNECQTAFVDPGATANDDCAGVLTVTTNSVVNPNATGSYTITYSATDPSANSSSATRTVYVVDTTAPVITMLGADPMTNECHSAFVDPGATANDACAGSVSVVTNNTVNPDATGNYTITYTATDPSGNVSTVTRTVYVVDTTPAVVAVLGPNPMTNECHSAFVDPGATANDACAGALSVVTNTSVDPNAVGNYTITYTATDPSGNTSSASRTVYVVDTTPPVIAMLGANSMTNDCQGGFVDPGATAIDACAGSVSVVTNTAVIPNADGSYIITYTATDPSGNSSSATRTVYVNDSTPPVVTILGANPLTNECHSTFVDPGATANDACAGSVSVVTNNTVDPDATGSYTITYTATDPSGNTASATRTVYVNDTTPPVIACSSNISVFTTNMAGTAVFFSTTATDLCSGAASVISTPPSGSVFPLGTNTVQCTATDASSNSSVCSFTVTVTFDQPPPSGQYAVGVVQNQPRGVQIPKLLPVESNSDSGNLTISHVSAASTNGGQVTLTDTNVIYQPPTNYVGPDLFTYTVSDGRGGFATSSVFGQVFSADDTSLNRLGDVTSTPGGMLVRFAGIPGYSYLIERSPDGIAWTALQRVTAPANGLIDFLDASPPAGPAYYRTRTSTP